MGVIDIINGVNNYNVMKSFIKANHIIKCHNNILVSISGGSDSDIMIDMFERLRGGQRITYVWFNTGLEYQATKDHLDYLENKYNIKIERILAVKPIPTCCKEYGQPFLSKYASEMISRLQRHNFKWEDKPFEELYKEYPKCKASLKWWCNMWDEPSKAPCKFNIRYNKYLKEFLIANPPDFKISNKCCDYAKKKPAKNFKKKLNADLNCVGIRKAEGGVRAIAYKSCFDDKTGEPDEFRPIFWLKNEDKKDYEKFFKVKHSDCYEKWGMKRTGCVGCPFNIKVLEELELVQKYEPKLYKACMNIFGKSYEYTEKYRRFKAKKKLEEIGQITFW